ncbi:hypothetical protein [Methylomonas sp. AM2-LC]|uniref:hypothetical protein n=1 Tax=Methylomonas sp. AM2-LC TaxID=3153301 RepID=UPI0032650852
MLKIDFIRKLFNRIYDRIRRDYANPIIADFLEFYVKLTYSTRKKSVPHNLDKKLIVSLTSYPPRFPKLPLTLKCLLSQSIKPDHLILWISHDDKHALTPEILALQDVGLEINFCDDLRSFTKIIPTLINYPDSIVVTADDDLYYWSTWLEDLTKAYQEDSRSVICHRAHQIRCNGDGYPLPYNDWVFDTGIQKVSPLIFLTGVGGVLYPSGIFHPDVLDVDQFKKLCPYADDVWLYWMVRLNGAMVRKIGPVRVHYNWRNTQQYGLVMNNVYGSRNDGQIQAMINVYGLPAMVDEAENIN